MCRTVHSFSTAVPRWRHQACTHLPHAVPQPLDDRTTGGFDGRFHDNAVGRLLSLALVFRTTSAARSAILRREATNRNGTESLLLYTKAEQIIFTKWKFLLQFWKCDEDLGAFALTVGLVPHRIIPKLRDFDWLLPHLRCPNSTHRFPSPPPSSRLRSPSSSPRPSPPPCLPPTAGWGRRRRSSAAVARCTRPCWEEGTSAPEGCTCPPPSTTIQTPTPRGSTAGGTSNMTCN